MRSLCVIHRFLKDSQNYGSGTGNSGRKPKFSSRFKRRVVKEALDNPARGVHGVASSLRQISKSSVHRILQADENIVLAKAAATPQAAEAPMGCENPEEQHRLLQHHLDRREEI
jgi:hypothetical protein